MKIHPNGNVNLDICGTFVKSHAAKLFFGSQTFLANYIYISIKIDIIRFMDTLLTIKALSNETRFKILEWLKHPEEHFDPQEHMPASCNFKGGICVGSISQKTGLAQSVVSGYLVKLQKAGLLESHRAGQWTYYRRNEEGINRFIEQLKKEL
jgi:ArsR family transcriptional regulator